jgi:ligand-binding sensor domain-containing protein/DNA-binding CsgD family transcriptional regulator
MVTTRATRFVFRLPWLLCACLVVPSPADARTFAPVGATNGLEARVAVSMLMDRDGFLWVGSREGLFRYDGYQTVAFLPDPEDPESIGDIDIRWVYESSDGDIWVGTNTGGLDRFRQASGSFEHFRHDSADPLSIIDDSIYGISEGPDGRLWVSTQKGLSRLDRASGTFEHFRHDPDDPSSLSYDWAYNLHLSDRGNLWISTVGGGVNRWDPEMRNFTRFDLAALTGGPADRNDAFALHEDDEGILWVGTRQGLVRLDPAAENAQYVDLGQQDGYLPVITQMKADDAGRLWMTTMIRGVLIFDTVTGEWEPASQLPLGSADYLPAQPQMSLVLGSQLLFVGTWGSGVFRAPISESPFGFLSQQTSDGLNNNTISAVMASEEPGRPWLGSFGGGPQRADVRAQRIETDALKSDPMRLSGVMSMARTADSRLFAATTDGLYEFNADGTQADLFVHDPARPEGIGDGYVITLLAAGRSDLWVGMGGSGLHYFEGSNGAFTTYRHDPAVPDSLSGDFITSLLDGREGYIWVGTRSNGLNRCRTETWSCRQFSGRKGDTGGLSHFHVTALYKDRRERVWVATDGGGLNQVVQDDDGRVTGFRQWTRDDGLLNDGIMAVQEDLDESLWLSTRHGLSRLNPATGDVVNFVSESGLPVSHFNTNASAADPDFIYFGSVDGLLSIPKGSLLATRQPPDVRVTSVESMMRGQTRRTAHSTESALRLPYGEILSVHLAVLDYSESSHEYAYRLAADDPWTELGAQRQMIFYGLAPGRYAFQARGRDVYGSWGESEVLSLVIIPPFWMQTWFRVLLVVLVAALAWALHLARQRALKRRANEMLRLGATRERALEQRLGSEAELAVLTPRQKEILQLIAEGYSTRDIGELLGVSMKTVQAHRANLMERLEIDDMASLVRLAVRTGLVSSQSR